MKALARLAALIWLFAVNPAPAFGQSAPSATCTPGRAAETDAVRAGIQALTRGQTAVTLVVAPKPLATLQERINDVHLQMSLQGWTFVGQEFVQEEEEGGILLVSYRR
jgi:hypothetical protein